MQLLVVKILVLLVLCKPCEDWKRWNTVELTARQWQCPIATFFVRWLFFPHYHDSLPYRCGNSSSRLAIAYQCFLSTSVQMFSSPFRITPPRTPCHSSTTYQWQHIDKVQRPPQTHRSSTHSVRHWNDEGRKIASFFTYFFLLFLHLFSSSLKVK